ncbi:MAG: alpha/beta fold hydrolase [Cyclobacteriaceae bacterium]
MHPIQKNQVFLLHFAGGNSRSFHFLRPYKPNDYEFHFLELPGRGKRIGESLLDTEPEAIDDLFTQIKQLRNNKPYVIFGHSMGACLALTITKKMEQMNDAPSRLIVAGNAGPGTGDTKKRSGYSDEAMKEELLSLGGVPKEVLENEDLFNFFSPVMRADFKVVEDFESSDMDFKVRTPIIALMGDIEETVEEIENWKNFTIGMFKTRLLPGNHFFINDHPAELVKIMTQSGVL